MKAANLIPTYLMVFAALTSGCKSSSVEKINFDKMFSDISSDANRSLSSSGINVDFCSRLNRDWDSIVVITPYASIDKIKKLALANFESISSEVESAKYSEQQTQLLLVKKNQIIGYGSLSYKPLDLSSLLHQDGSPVIISQADCNLMAIVKVAQHPGSWRLEIM